MSSLTIKTELISLIENETDSNVLEAIKILLEKANIHQTVTKKLTSRALAAEEDIASSRVMDKQELENRLGKKLGK